MSDPGAYRPFRLQSPARLRIILPRMVVLDADIAAAVIAHYALRRAA